MPRYEPQVFPQPVKACPDTNRTCATGCQAIGKVQAKADARKAEASVPKMAVAASDGRFERKMETGGDWQNLSIWVPESVILEESRVTEAVTASQKGAENTEVSSRRTSNFRHLALWPSECDSRNELVIQPNSQTETRTI